MLLSLDSFPAAARPSRLSELPDGAAGTRATLARMAQLIRDAAVAESVRGLAESIVADVPSKDYLRELAVIQAWVRENVRYTRDVSGVETLIKPAALIASRQGDCDDHAMLVGALAMSVGFPVRLVALGYQAPGVYDHVLAECKIGAAWLTVETTEPVPVGWRPARPACFLVEYV